MTLVTRWWWIRHAPVNSGGRVYGNDDPPADVSDEAGLSALADILPGDALWVVTNLQRTRQTHDALRRDPQDREPQGLEGTAVDALAHPHVTEPRFAEQSFGHWQGMTHEELAKRRDKTWTRFWLAPAHETPPGGESFVALMARVNDAIHELNRSHAGRDLVVVAHGGTIRAALALALNLDPEKALSWSIDNASLTRLDHFPAATSEDQIGPREEQWRVMQVNHRPLVTLR